MSHPNEWRVMIARTTDGMVLEDVRPASAPSFDRTLNEAGSWSVDVQMDDPSNEHVDFRTYATSIRYSWVICYGSYVVQAGPVTSYSVDDANNSLSVGGTGIGEMFKRRVLRNPTGHTAIVDPSQDITYEGELLWEVMRRLAIYGVADGDRVEEGLPSYLPITAPEGWPNQGSDNGHEGTYYGYDLATVWERMTQLSERINGPEFEFSPYLTPDGMYVRWEFRIGTPLLGDQESLHVWDYGSALTNLAVDGDGSAATVTQVWVKGDGTDRGLKTGWEHDPSLYDIGYPRADYVDSEHTSVEKQQTLEDYADQALVSFRWPTETWSADVLVDGDASAPALSTWALGDCPNFAVTEHPWIPDGLYRARITAFSNSGADRVSLTLQDIEANYG